MKKTPHLKKIDILAIAFGALLIGVFLSSTLNVFAFIGPTQNPPGGAGAVSNDASNNVTIGGASTTISGNLTVGGTLSASGLGSSITAGNVTAGVFGSNGLGGSYAFPLAGNLGVNTSTANSLPQPLSVYGGGYFSGSVGIGTTTPGTALDVNGDITDENLISSPFLTTSATGKLQAGTVLGTANGGTATTTALGTLAFASTPLSASLGGTATTTSLGTNAFTSTAFLPIATAATSTWVLTSVGGSWVAAAPAAGGLSSYNVSSANAFISVSTTTTSASLTFSSTSLNLGSAAYQNTGYWLSSTTTYLASYNVTSSNPFITVTTSTNSASLAFSSSSLSLGTLSRQNVPSSGIMQSNGTTVSFYAIPLAAADGGTATSTAVGTNAFVSASSTINLTISNPTTTAPSYTKAAWDYKRIITKITCVDVAGTTTLEFYKSSGLTSNSKVSEIVTSLACGTAGNSTVSFTTTTLMTNEALFVNVISTAGTPTETSVEINTYRQ